MSGQARLARTRGRFASMASHKFKIVQLVYFDVPAILSPAEGVYHITALLPAEGSEFQYRIKSERETFERVAKESQLIRVGYG